MAQQEEIVNTWEKEKEELKHEFELITNKYCMFEGHQQSGVSEKLKLRFAKTKKEMQNLIAAL